MQCDSLQGAKSPKRAQKVHITPPHLLVAWFCTVSGSISTPYGWQFVDKFGIAEIQTQTTSVWRVKEKEKWHGKFFYSSFSFQKVRADWKSSSVEFQRSSGNLEQAGLQTVRTACSSFVSQPGEFSPHLWLPSGKKNHHEQHHSQSHIHVSRIQEGKGQPRKPPQRNSATWALR